MSGGTTALVIAGLAVSAVAAGVSAYQASEAAGKQQDQYKAQMQAQADQNALNQMAIDRQRQQALGKQAALYSASGVTLEGTPTDIFSQTSGEYARTSYNAQFGTNIISGDLQARSDAAGANANSKITGTLLNTALQGLHTAGGITSTPVTSSAGTFGGSDYGAALYNPGAGSGATSPY